jgi:hypothetical protein
VAARFGSFVNPLSDRITSVIDQELAAPVQSVASARGQNPQIAFFYN